MEITSPGSSRTPGISTLRRQEIVSQVKSAISRLVSERPEENFSAVLSRSLCLNYTYIANTFSQSEGMTIERYLINCRIEKSMELLASGRSIGEVARLLHFSSIGHFSNQFKKVKGRSPSRFRSLTQ